MSRPVCEGTGLPPNEPFVHDGGGQPVLPGYSGLCPVCNGRFRVNHRGELFRHKQPPQAPIKPTASVSYAGCTIYSTEPGLNCPLCAAVIEPGVVHRCERPGV